MRALRAIALGATAGCGLGGCGSAALQTARAPTDYRPAQATVIFTCAGRGQTRPASIPLFCADDGATITGVRLTAGGLSLLGTSAAYSELTIVTPGRPSVAPETFSLTINGPVLK